MSQSQGQSSQGQSSQWQSSQWQADLMPPREGAYHAPPPRMASLLLLAIMALISSFLIWANYAEIDEVTHAEGRVVLSSKTQEIQNLEGGILDELLVKEGDHVKKGEVLLRIDGTIAKAAYRQNRTEYLTLLAELARLTAESENNEPIFPNSVIQENPAVVKNQKVLFNTRRLEHFNNLAILERQSSQRRYELSELKEKAKGLQTSLDLLAKEISMNRPLVKSGAAAEGDLLQLERLVAERQNELAIIHFSIPRGESALAETQDRIKSESLSFKREALSGIDQRKARLGSIQGSAFADQDRIRRTEVTSPVDGIVNRIHFTTIHGIIRSGETILEITPVEDTLLIEAWVSPQDVAFLRPGLSGSVSITAYDQSIFGSLDGTLIALSADTFDDKEGGLGRFRIQVRTDKTQFEREGDFFPIIPGMTASVDILTGKKTILDYLLKPILKIKQRAFSER